MKHTTQFLKFSFLIMLCGGLMLNCKKNDALPPPQGTGNLPPVNNVDIANADTISNHLQFIAARKIPGDIRDAQAGGSSLKFSIKDTLRLVGNLPLPIKFLHDKVSNVAGAYIQVHSFVGSSNTIIYGTYHYDVPELTEVAENDTVSTIMIGFDRADFELPISFGVTITPYSEGGQPLDQTTVPVKIDEPTGSCGLVLPPGEYWEWEHSYILDREYIHTWIPINPAYPDTQSVHNSVYKYYYAPEKVWGGNQMIKGCCANGTSDYGATCLQGDPRNERILPFPTYYQQDYESLEFRDNGTFKRTTRENSANPAPDESDFCNGIVGIVDIKSKAADYEGNWTITPGVTVTVKDLYEEEERTLNYLRLQTTSSTGSGWGNPGGSVIHLSCNQIILLQPDNESGDNDLWKVYERVGADGVKWYILHH